MQSRFAQIFGASNVKVESYAVTAPVTKSATLNGQPVYPIYPNAVVPSTTPLDGISAPMIYAGQGLPQNFNGQKIQGAIVVLEFNSGLGWITAADLGARAIVFLEPQQTLNAAQQSEALDNQIAPSSRGEAERKFASLPIEIPRYYAPRSLVAGLPANATTSNENSLASAVAVGNGVLKSEVRWERVNCSNVLGTLQGTDPNIANKPGGTLIIGGYYDSMAITPDLAPGAEAAGNAAALLELARQFKARPPKYTVLFMAEGAHHIALAGMRNFAATHFIDTTGKEDKAVKARIDSYKGFVGLDLTSRTNTVGLFAKSSFYNQMTVGAENILLNQFADFAKTINAQADRISKQRGVREEEFYVDGVTGREGRTWRSYLPSPVALDSEVATMAQKPAVSFATANDARNLQDTPFDTADRLNYANLGNQITTIAALLNGAVPDLKRWPDAGGFSQIFGYAIGRSIYRNVGAGASFLPSTPLPDEKLLDGDMQVPGDKPMDADTLKNVQGAQAVAFILDRNTSYKSYSGVRGAFIERATFSKPTKDEKPVAQFLFIGPRVGDPQGRWHAAK